MKDNLTNFINAKIKSIYKINKNHGLLYNFYTILSIALISIIIIVTSLLFIGFKNSSIDIINKYIKDDLLQVSRSSNVIADNSRELLLQILSDKDLISILGTYEPTAEKLSIALNRLENYKLSNPFIHSIYIYNGYYDKFYTSIPSQTMKSANHFFDRDILDILNNLNTIDLKYPVPRKIDISTSTSAEDKTSKVYTFIVSDRNSTSIFPSSSIILNIREEWLNNIINNVNVNYMSDTFIINNDGILVSSSENYDILSDISNINYIQRILNSKNDSGFFLAKVDEKKMMITYITSEKFPEWKFIQMCPNDIITKNLFGIKVKLFIILPILLISAMLLSRYISQKMYKPVNNLELNYKKLEAKNRNNYYTLKQEFLSGLLKNTSIYTRNSLDSLLKENNLKLNLNSKYIILLITIDNFSEFSLKYSLSDRNIYKYSIINICDEFSNKYIEFNSVDIDVKRIAVILNISPDLTTEDLLLYLESYITKIQKSVSELLNISLSFVVSTTAEDISMLSSLYQEVLDASVYKIFFGNKSIIFADSIYEKENKSFNYPYKTHELLFDNLNLGNFNEVRNLYNEIIFCSLEYSYSSFINTLLNISFSITSTISELNIKKGIIIKYNQNAFIKSIYSLESLDGINKLFIDLFSLICTSINNCKSNKKEKNYDELIAKIFDIMQNNYTNPDTCIQSIADEVNMSSAYLGRLFTSLTNKSITESLNELRMAKCCTLLLNTNEPVSNIYIQCGFNSLTYCYKVFKKTYGLTPSEYRNISTDT